MESELDPAVGTAFDGATFDGATPAVLMAVGTAFDAAFDDGTTTAVESRCQSAGCSADRALDGRGTIGFTIYLAATAFGFIRSLGGGTTFIAALGAVDPSSVDAILVASSAATAGNLDRNLSRRFLIDTCV